MRRPGRPDAPLHEGRCDADDCGKPDESRRGPAQDPFGENMQSRGRLQMQPASPENDVADEHCERAKGRKDVEDAPAEAIRVDCYALNETAGDETLHQRRDNGVEAEGDIPDPPALLDLIAELEGDAAQAQREQHDDARLSFPK